jgi:transposase
VKLYLENFLTLFFKAINQKLEEKKLNSLKIMDMEARKALKAIFYIMRTGIQWNAIPKIFGSSSAIHRYFLFWCEEGFFQSLWACGL